MLKIERLMKGVNKATLENEVMGIKPKDYTDRNKVYMQFSLFFSWVLQIMSVLAGAYLFYDYFKSFVLNDYLTVGVVVFGVALFFFVEAGSRVLLNSLGYHYVATYSIVNGIKTNGVILQTKAGIYICLRLIMLFIGTYGVGTFFFNVSYLPKTKDVKTVTTLINGSLEKYNTSIRHDEEIISKFQNRKDKLANNQNEGNYWGNYSQILELDKQIQSATANKQKTLDLVSKLHERANLLEDKTKSENKTEIAKTEKDSLQKSIIAGAVWAVFEFLLFLSLIYVWVYKVGVKRELMLKEGLITKPVSKNFGSNQNEEKNKNTTEVEVHSHSHYDKHIDLAPKVYVKTETLTETDGYNCTCLTCKTQVVKKRPAIFCSPKCKNTWHNSKTFTDNDKKIRLTELGYDKNAFPAIVPLKNA